MVDTFLEQVFQSTTEKSASYGQDDLTQEETSLLDAAKRAVVKQANDQNLDLSAVSDEVKDKMLAEAVEVEKQAYTESVDAELRSACERVMLATDVGIATGQRTADTNSGGFLKSACFHKDPIDEFLEKAAEQGMSKEDIIKLASDEAALGAYAGEVAVEVAEMLKQGLLTAKDTPIVSKNFSSDVYPGATNLKSKTAKTAKEAYEAGKAAKSGWMSAALNKVKALPMAAKVGIPAAFLVGGAANSLLRNHDRG